MLIADGGRKVVATGKNTTAGRFPLPTCTTPATRNRNVHQPRGQGKSPQFFVSTIADVAAGSRRQRHVKPGTNATDQ